MLLTQGGRGSGGGEAGRAPSRVRAPCGGGGAAAGRALVEPCPPGRMEGPLLHARCRGRLSFCSCWQRPHAPLGRPPPPGLSLLPRWCGAHDSRGGGCRKKGIGRWRTQSAVWVDLFGGSEALHAPTRWAAARAPIPAARKCENCTRVIPQNNDMRVEMLSSSFYRHPCRKNGASRAHSSNNTLSNVVLMGGRREYFARHSHVFSTESVLRQAPDALERAPALLRPPPPPPPPAACGGGRVSGCAPARGAVRGPRGPPHPHRRAGPRRRNAPAVEVCNVKGCHEIA